MANVCQGLYMGEDCILWRAIFRLTQDQGWVKEFRVQGSGFWRWGHLG